MRWLCFLLLIEGTHSLLAEPLPPLPIEEATDNFNIDGSPDENLQLSLFDKEEKVEETTRNEGITFTEETENPQEETTLVPPTTTLLPVVQSLRFRGPPSIRPPVGAIKPRVESAPEESEEEEEELEITTSSTAHATQTKTTTTSPTTTTTPPTTTTTATTTTSTTTTTITTTTTTTPPTTIPATTGELTTEPMILIPLPDDSAASEITTTEPFREFTESPPIIEFETEEPRVLIPLPNTDTVTEPTFLPTPEESPIFAPPPSEVPEIFLPNQEAAILDISVTDQLPAAVDEESFFTPEPTVTVQIPTEEDTSIIPTAPRRRLSTSRFRVAETTTEAVILESTSVPETKHGFTSDLEMVEELVKELPSMSPHVLPTVESTVTPKSTVRVANSSSTRRTGDVTAQTSSRTLHRGQPRRSHRKNFGGQNRRLLRIRPGHPNSSAASHPFRNSSSVVRRPKFQKKVRRLRKKTLHGVSHRITNTNI